MPWWVWLLLAALLIAALIWWATDDDEVETAAVVPVAVTTVPLPAPAIPPPGSGLPEPVAQQGDVSIADILGRSAAAAFAGQSFTEEVQVAGVPTDRAFWIEDQGARLLTVIVDQPQESPMDIEEGQRLRIQGGTLRDASYISNLQGQSLDQDTLELLRQQKIFLVAGEGAIEPLGAAQG